MNVPTLLTLPTMLLAMTGSLPAQRLLLDSSHAFFATSEGTGVEGVAAETDAGPITRDAWLRYPGSRTATRGLEELAFDFLLARECEASGVARSAPALAPALATRRLLESGRTETADADGNLRARFATDALRQLRVDALVGAARKIDPEAMRARFDHRYGAGGVRVRVRHVLVRADGAQDAAARERAQALHRRLMAGEDFAALLPESDDRTTRRLLRDPTQREAAGFVEGYNYQRFGETFADAVRGLDVGAISEPVLSPVGYHLIQVVDRKVTRLANVADAIAKELGGGKAKQSEIDALRERLFRKYALHVIGAAASPSQQDPAKPAAAARPTSSATDWPHYRGDPRLHGIAAGAIGDKPELAWTFTTKAEILSSPVIVGDTVYIGSTDNSVYAIDLATGEQRWAFATPDMVEAPPLWLDGRIYIGSSDGLLYALAADTGALLWKFETLDKILGGANWFRSKDGSLRLVVGSYDARLYCLDTDGKQLWIYETDNYVNGCPAVDNGEILFGGCDAALHVVSAETGERITRIELGSGCQVAGSVAVAGDKAYFGHYGNELLCVDLDSGNIDWRYGGNRQGFCSSPAIDEKHVVIGGRDKELHCVARRDGKPVWTFKTRRKIDASPVICGDKVVCGSGDGRLYLLRLADGAELWSYDIGQPVFSSPAVKNGMIVVGANDHRVYAFRAPIELDKDK